VIEVRRGNNRVVILIGSYAVKLPRARSWRGLLYGMLNNINEAEAQKPGACPVVASLGCGLVTIMRRARDLTDTEFDELVDVAGFKTITGLEVEPKRDSFGWLDGAIVAVDYGAPRELRW
jgi:hypothetical protein